MQVDKKSSMIMCVTRGGMRNCRLGQSSATIQRIARRGGSPAARSEYAVAPVGPGCTLGHCTIASPSRAPVALVAPCCHPDHPPPRHHLPA